MRVTVFPGASSRPAPTATSSTGAGSAATETAGAGVGAFTAGAMARAGASAGAGFTGAGFAGLRDTLRRAGAFGVDRDSSTGEATSTTGVAEDWSVRSRSGRTV